VGKNLIDEPLPACTGFGIFTGHERGVFVQYPYTAVCAGKKNGGKTCKKVTCGCDTVHLAHRTLHAAPYDTPEIEMFSIVPRGNKKKQEVRWETTLKTLK
jgi:hypothetical protein